MIGDSSLEELTSREESERLEFKRFPATENSESFARHLVGFANRGGGVILLGVNDNGNITGADIDTDTRLQTITNIAYQKCSPQITFDHRYIQHPEGDVLALEINSRGEIPHARVRRTQGGEIVCRDYTIRVANSTRRINDPNELKKLFDAEFDPDFQDGFKLWLILFKEEFTPPGLVMPSGVSELAWPFREADINATELIISNLMKITTQLFPFAFLRNLNFVHRLHWNVNIERYEQPFETTSLFNNFSAITPPVADVKVREDLVTEEMNDTQIDVIDFQNSALSPHFTEEQLVQSYEFKTLPGTSFTVDFSEEINTWVEFRISRPDKFEFRFSSFGGGSGPGLPNDHPLMKIGVETGFENIDLSDFQENLIYSEVDYQIDFDFEFPDSEDPQIQINELYAQSLLEIIQRRFDVETFLREIPGIEIYKLNFKIDRILNALGGGPK